MIKRLIARSLRHRTSWQLFAITCGCVLAVVAFYMSTFSSTQRQLRWLMILALGIGGAALVLSLVRRSEENAAHPRPLRMWAWLLGAYLLVGAMATYTYYSLDVYSTKMLSGCGYASILTTRAEREAELARARARLTSPLAWLPLLLGNNAPLKCLWTERDLERLDRGLCPHSFIQDDSCTCGGKRYQDASCKEPYCYYSVGKPDIFYCPGGEMPEGYNTHYSSVQDVPR